MAIRHEGGETRPARRSTRRWSDSTVFRPSAQAKDGPDDQIRVHLNHLGCPVLCDRQYGGRSQITRGEIRRDPADDLILLDRQALHARRLRFLHPATGDLLEVEAPLPADIAAVLEELRIYRA